MRISLLKDTRLENYDLPNQIYGNYWITDLDENGEIRSLVNAEAAGDHWQIKSNENVQILSGTSPVDAAVVMPFAFYTLQLKGRKTAIILYCSDTYDASTRPFQIKGEGEITIGSGTSSTIVYPTTAVGSKQAVLTCHNAVWTLQNANEKIPLYVNSRRFSKGSVAYGDVIFIMGLKIFILGDTLWINNPNGQLRIQQKQLVPVGEDVPYTREETSIEELTLYEKNAYFFRAPRFRSNVATVKIKIDAPPQRDKGDKMPLIYTVGPMLTMGMTSVVTGGTTLMRVASGEQTMTSALPSLIIAGAMLMSMMVWPLLSKGYEKQQRWKKERLRQKKYKKYLEEKRKEIESAIAHERTALTNNFLPVEECEQIILNKKRNLWERKIDHDDFLDLRLGVGQHKPDIEISAPEARFTLEEDNLREKLDQVVSMSTVMSEVPVHLNFTKDFVSAIIGNVHATTLFIQQLLLQLFTFHSYEEVKVVIFTSEENAHRWEDIKNSPYCWNDDKQVRFFSTNLDEANQVCNYLLEDFNARLDSKGENRDIDYRSFSPYYFIITDDFAKIRNIEFVKEVLDQTTNYGFSFVVRTDRLLGLPNQCSRFINVNQGIKSSIVGNELNYNKENEFNADLVENIPMRDLCIALANTPIELDREHYFLPDVLPFLEMYNVGNIVQLNPLTRWKNSNPTISLQAPVGMDENGELFKLDLHEKFHGPHGLIAGMTGSGKSEFIITYILSMALNYHPDEVAFVLIDYKGGGLAGAFENKETGVRLPHLAGTITNLDTAEMKRSLASIQSELRRRQKIFNKARELLNESTIDIYKYQRLYRSGAVTEPVPHLFIISDEFAELKTQQPEFMEQLISTARIGRSLGVHLILATQKPSGVVDDQIWSNSRFRVCLKVQEKSDSMDMIKRPDAAALKHVGRFYLQVGYNELFALGQSAWCGAPYIETDAPQKKIDHSIQFISPTGYVTKTVEVDKKDEYGIRKGEQLPNIVSYLYQLGQEHHIATRKLWLDKIPEFITVENLKKKYNYQSQAHVINPVIGEYDDPNNQQQYLMTLPLSLEGNAIVYGSAGSGKEKLLTTLLFSAITTYSSAEVNFYILDFGAETMKSFTDAPHVGGIILSHEAEKIHNLFKMINEILEKRKKEFSNYNGNYQTYCEKSGNIVPTIVVIINYYEAFVEMYGEYDEMLVPLSRECVKYGVILVLTTNGTNAVRYRLRQNFKQELVLQLNDESDYSSILGNIHRMVPSKIKGRGLIKYDTVYEFQTASVVDNEYLSEYIKDTCMQLSEAATERAMKIPVLPEEVTSEFVKDDCHSLYEVPVGVEKQDLKISTYDFKGRYCTFVSAQDRYFDKFIPELVDVFNLIPNTTVVVLDAEKAVEKCKERKCAYYTNHFDDAMKSITNYYDQLESILEKNHRDDAVLERCGDIVCIISGIEGFIDHLTEEGKKNLGAFFQRGKKYKNVTFILVDVIDQIKKYEYEAWYKESINSSYGIWIGAGIADQFTLKLSRQPRFLRDEISGQFGYVVKAGIPVLVKLLGDKEGQDEL